MTSLLSRRRSTTTAIWSSLTPAITTPGLVTVKIQFPFLDNEVMNRWGSIRETTFEAIKAPLVAATELTTREKAEKAKAGEEKKRKRVSSGTQKLKDVTGTQRGHSWVEIS